MSDTAVCLHDEVLADPGPSEGEPNEVVIWVADVFRLVEFIKQVHPLPRYPDYVAGDACDEAVALSGLLLGLGVDATIPNSLGVFISKLKLQSERSQRQEMSDVEAALKVCLARLQVLNKMGYGDIFIPTSGNLKLYADPFIQGGVECLIKVEELPPGHRLRDLLPPSELCLEKYLCLGNWITNVFGHRVPPGGLRLDEIKRRTKEMRKIG